MKQRYSNKTDEHNIVLHQHSAVFNIRTINSATLNSATLNKATFKIATSNSKILQWYNIK